jgi:hypothetical protein
LHLPQVHDVSAADGIVTLVAGSPAGSSGTANGLGTASMFYNPKGLSLHTDGSIIIGDYFNHVIRKLSTAGIACEVRYFLSSVLEFYYLQSWIFIPSFYSFQIFLDAHVYSAVVTTVAGTMTVIGYLNAVGIAAQFYTPTGVAVDSVGAIYVADNGNNLIRKIATSSWFIHLTI